MRFVVLLVAVACGRTATPSASPPPPSPSEAAAGSAVTPNTGASDKLVAAAPAAHDAAATIVGTTPPEWQAERWMNTEPITFASLRGSVVLVRWWTAGCPYCSTSAPALRTFHTGYKDRGLRVVGLYHHKEDGPFDPRVYEDTARRYGFTFPIAVDPEWRTLGTWLRNARDEKVDTGWTSVSLLIDKRGVVRHVHPGGHYVEGDAAHTALRDQIERLIAER